MSGDVINDEKKSAKPKDVNLVELLLKLWSERKLLIKNCCIGAVIGVIMAFSIPKEYATKVMLAPETSQKSIGGNLGSLASMAGLNLGSLTSEDAIQPELYPKIISSTPFLISLFDAKVETKKGELSTTLFDYMEKHQKVTWWSYFIILPVEGLKWVMDLIKGKEPIGGASNVDSFRLTKDQADVANAIDNRIRTSVDKKTGVISIVVKMQDPLISAAIADSVKNKLQEFVTTYRTNKARKDLEFAESLYEEAQKEYLKAQKAYAEFTDGNMNIVLARYKAEEERLKNKMSLSYGVFSQVAQQLQLAKAKVQETTPVYTVLQPATVPFKGAGPKKLVILFVVVFLFFTFTAAWVLLKNDVLTIKSLFSKKGSS